MRQTADLTVSTVVAALLGLVLPFVKQSLHGPWTHLLILRVSIGYQAKQGPGKRPLHTPYPLASRTSMAALKTNACWGHPSFAPVTLQKQRHCRQSFEPLCSSLRFNPKRLEPHSAPTGISTWSTVAQQRNLKASSWSRGKDLHLADWPPMSRAT